MHLLKIAQVLNLVGVGVGSTNLVLELTLLGGQLACLSVSGNVIPWPSLVLQPAMCVPLPVKALEIEPWLPRSAARSKSS